MSIFTQVEHQHIKSNTFDLSHDRKQSMKFGELTPIHVQEILPGDSISMSTSQMLRMAPMVAPIMHAVNVYTHFFFVPNRILWDNWEDFITGGEDGTAEPSMPLVKVADGAPLDVGSLADYMGIPTGNTSMLVNAIPFAAYVKIYDEYYRDQNLIDPLYEPLTDSDNAYYAPIADGKCLKRAWQHDYFTSALPWTQKGPEATIPLGTSADIMYDNTDNNFTTFFNATTNAPFPNTVWNNMVTDINSDMQWENGGVRYHAGIDNSEQLYADLSTASAASINDLRRAFKLQEFLEKNARGGSRYIETILVHFGIKSPDGRMQRPEFLGGGTSPMTISEVLQTSDAAAGDTPQGNMAGHGISVGANNSFKFNATEHGFIIGIMSVMPKPAYQQGIPKHFLKRDKFDIYWPSFAHIGEQPIEQQEIYYEALTAQDTFGYTPRYAEYKFMNSSVHGEFRTTLDFWHWGRIFENPPALNQEFIECVPSDRIFAVLESEQIYCHIFHRIKARRKMPYFGTPKL